LHRRLAAQQDGTGRPAPKLNATRCNVIVGTSAAAAAVAAVSVDRALIDGSRVADGGNSRELTDRRRHVALRRRLRHRVRPPGERQARSRVRRVHSSGLPAVVRRARREIALPVPFGVDFPAGQVLAHQLPIAPKPLPMLMVGEQDGVIEVLVTQYLTNLPDRL
jgi:hypothetical protein